MANLNSLLKLMGASALVVGAVPIHADTSFIYKKNVKDLIVTSSGSPNLPSASWDTSNDSLNFGALFEGQSKTLTVSLLNTGDRSILFSSSDIISQGEGISTTHDCSNVLSNQSCNINVTALGLKKPAPLSGKVTINAAGLSKIIVLNASYLYNDLEIYPSNVEFGNTFINEIATKSFLIENKGTLPLVVPSFVSTNSAFSLQHNCGTLQPSQSCTVGVTSQSSSVGAQSGGVVIPAGGSGKSVTFNANYVAPSATLSPQSGSSSNFGNVDLNSTAVQTYVYKNNSPVELSGLTVTPPSGTTVSSNNCTGSIAAGTTCTVQISWTPSDYTALSGALKIENSYISQTLALTGSVKQSTATSMDSSPISLGNVSQYSTKNAQLNFKNIGTSNMSISGLNGMPSELTVTNNTCSAVVPNGSCVITLNLNTNSSIGTKTVSLTTAGAVNNTSVSLSYSVIVAGTSCLDLKNLNSSLSSGTYTIDPDGSGPGAPVSVYCDMVTDGGGWTRVSSIDSGTSLVSGMMSTVTISDSNLSYSNVLLVAKSNMATHYETTSDISITPGWSSIGINPAIHGLKFGTSWYFLATVNTWRGYGSANTSPNYSLNLSGSVAWSNSNYTTVIANTATGAGSCDLNKQASQTFCGKAVKVAVPSGLKLTGYNDLESLSQSITGNTTHASNNRQIRALDIFVR